MNTHLQHLGELVGPQRHVVLVLDGAGWHVAKALNVPSNITLLHLPPYSPELNPIERLWAFMKSHYLSNQVFKDYDDLFAKVKTAWLQLDDPDSSPSPAPPGARARNNWDASHSDTAFQKGANVLISYADAA